MSWTLFIWVAMNHGCNKSSLEQVRNTSLGWLQTMKFLPWAVVGLIHPLLVLTLYRARRILTSMCTPSPHPPRNACLPDPAPAAPTPAGPRLCCTQHLLCRSWTPVPGSPGQVVCAAPSPDQLKTALHAVLYHTGQSRHWIPCDLMSLTPLDYMTS